MAAWLPEDPDAFVIELGPGTGSVTQAILDRGLRHDRLIAVEKSSKLAELLRERFPRIHVVTGDAEHLDRLSRKHLPRGKGIGAVISSLPLRNFAPDAANGLVKKIRSVLRPDGIWVQYSYHLGTQRREATYSFDLVRSDVVWLNLPPARISVFQKPAKTS
jgi:phosphatidylethanolamine/phosphatidyl-N-methylethanolamine N-methyltransferase